MSGEPEHPDLSEADDVLPTGTVLRVLVVTVLVGMSLSLTAVALFYSRESKLRPTREYPESRLASPLRFGPMRETLFGEPPARVRRDAAARRRLQEYGWVDREKRLVHIPVEVAMRLVGEGRW